QRHKWKKATHRAYPSTAVIQKGLRPQQKTFPPPPERFAAKRQKSVTRKPDTPAFRQAVCHPKPDVMTCSAVFRTRIPQPYDDTHGLPQRSFQLSAISFQLSRAGKEEPGIEALSPV